MVTFSGKIITATGSSKIKTDSKPPNFGSLDPKAMTSVSAMKGTNGAWTGIISDSPSAGDGSQALIIQKARKELIAEGDSSRDLQTGSHLEKVAKVYTLEAGEEIHLSSLGTIVIDADAISISDRNGGRILIAGGSVNIFGRPVNVNTGNLGAIQGTEAVPALPSSPNSRQIG